MNEKNINKSKAFKEIHGRNMEGKRYWSYNWQSSRVVVFMPHRRKHELSIEKSYGNVIQFDDFLSSGTA